MNINKVYKKIIIELYFIVVLIDSLILIDCLPNSTISDVSNINREPNLSSTHQKADHRRQLYGFRGDNSKYINHEGITVMDSEKPIHLTLFGSKFDPETIIGFTMEPARLSGDSIFDDCTDLDRVASYQLKEDNIVSPNMIRFFVVLPPTKTGDRYYFCIKQSDPLSPNRTTNQSKWVHQGEKYYLSMIVEQPIVTVTYEILLIVVLLVLSAVTSGLNLGLMSLDMNELAVISSCGSDREKSFARTIQPLRKRGNFLLCALLLGNVMVNSSLTVILEDLSSGLVAVIGSTLAIVILGEILPQAICARKGLEIGARTIFLTYLFMIVTFPLSYPISRLLDWVLGEENGHVYDRERLMEFIKITGHHTQLESDEVAIISGALKLKKIKVSEIMTRIEDVFMLPLQCQLDLQTIESIIHKGYSRVPVYEANDRRKIVALLLAKDLALLDPDDKTPVETMVQYCRHPLLFVEDHVTLDMALNEFKGGKSHMAIVRQIYDDGELDKYYEAIGVVTLEDVIEEVLQVEINDETDTLCK